MPASRPLDDLANAAWFYAIAVLLCVAVAVSAPLLGERALLLAMFTPAVAALVMRFARPDDGFAGLDALGLARAGLRGWPLALLLPCAVLAFSYAVACWSGVATFSPSPGPRAPLWFALDVVASIAAVSATAGLAEEIGWRGYLLPRLLALGTTRALLLGGLLHGLWHLPVLLFTPFYHPAGDRMLVIPLFLATLTMAGVCYGYLRLTTASVWPAAIAHGTFNVVWDRLRSMTATTSPAAMEYLSGESGVATLAALTVAAVVLARRLDR